MTAQEIVESAIKLKSAGFQASEIVALLKESVTQIVAERKAVRKSTAKTTTKKKAKTDGFSAKAKEKLKAYNLWHKSKNVGAFRQQRKKIVKEVKAGSEMTINQSTYQNGVRETKPATFATKNGGIVIEIQHYKGKGDSRELNYTDEKLLPY
jgi:hypothetical protein